MVYEYAISMQWQNTDSSGTVDQFDINSENINMLTMYKNYDKTIMPLIVAKLSLDKNYIDKIIKAASTAVIYLNISKMEKEATDDSTGENAAVAKVLTPYNGKMSYFIYKDINYNADIDYSGDGNEDREDVFDSFSIGLMFSECIEANKQTNNNTLVETTPFNAILSYIQSIPALIEPFTYNEEFAQLIVPPQDSLYKTIDFFNNIAVFYDTPYRFYLEPGCAYLLSSSGNPVGKQGELYDTVLLNIRAVNDDDANTEGMINDDQDKAYYADINVKDTTYKMDNSTSKLFNSISTIIDPSKNNTITMLDGVNSIMNKINGIVGDVKKELNTGLDNIKNIPSNMFDYKNLIAENLGQADALLAAVKTDTDSGIKIIQDMPTEADTAGDYYIDQQTKDDAIKQIQDIQTKMGTSQTNLDGLPAVYEKSTSLLNSAISDVTNLSGCFGGISAINLADNLSTTFQTMNNIKSSIGDQEKMVTTDLIPKAQEAANTITYTNAILKVFQNVSNSYPTAGINAEAKDPLAEIEEDLGYKAKDLQTYADNLSNTVVKYKAENLSVTALETAIEPTIKQFDTFKTDIKSSITGIVSDITNIGDMAKKSLDNIMNSVKNIEDSVKSLDFSIDSLQDLQKDINIVKDISKIGRLGISSFSTNLSLSGNSGTTDGGEVGTGSMIVRVENDNVNMVKNIKASIENNKAVLTVNKNGLDTGVFTPNKRYIIKNYNVHSDKDGVFVLNLKTDTFIRHADRYTLNTQLTFNKLYDDGNSKATPKKPLTPKNWEDIAKNAEEILRTQRGGITLDNISDVADNAQAIQDIFNGLKG